jgi:hypothetical protein
MQARLPKAIAQGRHRHEPLLRLSRGNSELNQNKSPPAFAMAAGT